jgi:hypothetical protein
MTTNVGKIGAVVDPGLMVQNVAAAWDEIRMAPQRSGEQGTRT